MQALLAAFALSFAGAAAAASPCAGDSCTEVIIQRIVDGDTVRVMIEDAVGVRETPRLRLLDIDAPERGQPGSADSRDALADKVFRRRVSLESEGNDRYGRMLGRIYLGERDISREMVREGYAWVRRPLGGGHSEALEESLLAAERVSRQAGAGIWSLPEAQRSPPWKWRRDRRVAAAANRRDMAAGTDNVAAGSLELLINEPTGAAGPSSRCATDICLRLLRMIESAGETIDFAIYGARNQPRILEALLAAQRRGVEVRGMVDRDRQGNTYYSSTNEWVQRLGPGAVVDDQARESPSDNYFEPGCPRPGGFEGPLQCLAYDLGDRWLLAEHASREDVTDPAKGGVNKIMHNKFFVVDGRHLWTGSANISNSGIGGYNANTVVVADSPPLAAVYTAEFDRLRVRREPDDRKERDGVEVLSVGDAEVTAWFSPQDRPLRFGVQALLATAKRSIDAPVFFLTSKHAAADLIDAHRRGVRVRVIVDATSAKNGYSKHELLRAAGVATKVENWGGKMHMKVAVVDGEFLVLGSMNWTSAGEDANDENTLLVRSRPLAERMAASFEDMWRSIPNRWAQSGSRPDPESLDSTGACFDGIDNDFDDLADGQDPGCRAAPPPLPSLPPHRLVTKAVPALAEGTRAGGRPPKSYRLYGPSSCDPSYPDWWVCLPERPGGTGRDFDCGDLPYRSITVRGTDPHRLDGDRDGKACEEYR